ncbi:MAG: 23S rRNA (guanosine(2251)-2'-O)-methyltransferase RlmB [Betaproteobacteria bacterium]|nr:23S rRNA (guanosine(2251)-2'-O)-methyltransferase RlmB [Betaproteobacteria bacterium]
MARMRLVYGVHAVSARLRQDAGNVREVYLAEGRADGRLRTLAALAAERGAKVVAVSIERLDRMLPGVRHQGVACECEAPTLRHDLDEVLDAVRGDPLVLVLDGVQDPHNLGACLRSADAMGVHAVVAPKDRAVGLTPVVEKVACGAAETVPYVMVTNLARTLDALKDRGLFVVGLAGEGDGPLAAQRLDGAVGLVLGAEGAGLRRLTRERCDVIASIPIVGTVESLNVSVAAGICLYEARRQRDSGHRMT